MNKFIIFDMDGVIFDTERLCLKIWKKISAKFNVFDIEKVYFECIGTNEDLTKKIMLKAYGTNFPYHDFKNLADKLFDGYEKLYKMPLKKGAKEILSYFKQKGYKIGLASSTKYERVKKELTHVNLFHFFDEIATGDMVINSKPSPDIYLLAAKKLNAYPEACYAIEDSKNGIIAAASANMKTIMIPDLLEPDSSIKKFINLKFLSLLDVISYDKTYSL